MAPIDPAHPAPAASGATAAAPAAFPPGTRLGPYRILGHLGSGGMGEVYRAHDEALARDVALKTIHRSLGQDGEFVRRFRAEAQAVARTSHPNLVQVFYCGEEQGTLFFGMEFVAGPSLADRLRTGGPLPWAEATGFALQAARGLAAAAAAGVVHRDVKPENLLLAPDGTVKVADFGLAKQVADAGVTATGVIVGTPRYLSPEQAQGEVADFRSDIYSLGATLFHLIAGRPVFDGPSALKVCMKHIQEAPPELSSAAPGVPPAISRLVSRMLAKRRDDRHPSYAALIAEMEAILGEAKGAATERLVPAAAAAPTPPPPAPRADTPTRAPLLEISRRADGGVAVDVNCPITGTPPPLKEAWSAAPLAPRGRRLAADLVDFGHLVVVFALLELFLFPLSLSPSVHSVVHALLAGFVGVAMSVYLTRRGGTPGERLADVRLVSRTGVFPVVNSVGVGFIMSKWSPLAAIVFGSLLWRVDLDALEVTRLLLTEAVLIVLPAIDYGLALGTGRSFRDRLFKTRVIDTRGLPSEDEPA